MVVIDDPTSRRLARAGGRSGVVEYGIIAPISGRIGIPPGPTIPPIWYVGIAAEPTLPLDEGKGPRMRSL
jgi:hypothetical protein